MRPSPITVSTLNNYIKNVIADNEMLNNVYVKGEISNLKMHYSGHIYFTLKDEASLIKCVMFKSYTGNMNFVPKDGMNVLILGSVAVYERDGVYQIYAKAMEQDGIGDLYAAYEKLKEKLDMEGLFDEAHKKGIPKLPKAIGVVTSRTGAVIRDIINVTTRRLPNVHIKLYPAAVQGKGAAETIVKAIEKFNKERNVDVIIVGRGGGSLEDLWPFNEEITARAIYNSEIPIISAVGHETDFTIADFVADLRAPTPSAAAELAVPDINEINFKINNIKGRLSFGLRKKIDNEKDRFKYIIKSRALRMPKEKIQTSMLNIDGILKRLVYVSSAILKEKNSKLKNSIAVLDNLSPLKTLKRGYSIIKDENGNIIRDEKGLHQGDVVGITFWNGSRNAKII